MIEPEPTERPPREAAGDRARAHGGVRRGDARQRCGPYRLDFYATPDAVVCVVSDDELVRT
ncbi:hypothetical protein [Saccharothrix hoggarensis]|uniref:Uncharacterized protein n=1 Tax=Saccharothrix hoggarensis TaxID=913853 RepID=A0ABW3QRJ3_9PSEU